MRMNGQTPTPEMMPPGYLAQPSPLEVTVGVIPASMSEDQTPYVMLKIETVVGSLQIVLPVDVAEQTGRALVQGSVQASTGLIVPG